MYGLDIEFLKELDLGDMVEDVKKSEAKQQSKGKGVMAEFEEGGGGYENKTIKQLQEEFNLQQSHVKKLRGTCRDYRDKERSPSVSSGEE